MSFLSHKGDIMTAQKYIVLVEVENANREDVECYEDVKFYDIKNFIETSKLDAVVMPISEFTSMFNNQEINPEEYWIASIFLENENTISKFKLSNTGDKNYYVQEYKAGEFGIYENERLIADCFESVEHAQEWYVKEAMVDAGVSCAYCEEKNESTHFICEACGVGMCEDCYSSEKEHCIHYHMPLESCKEIHTDLIKKICKSDNPQYICEKCMTKALSLEPEDFAQDRKIGYVAFAIQKLIGTRWKSKKHLENYLDETFQIDTNLSDVDESGLVGDYAFLGSIFQNYGYMDIYYLKIPFDKSGSNNTIYITEIAVSAE
jgi:hypothetical protein